MGLFSFGNKNKQETVRDSGHFVKDDDAAFSERARSKRATHAGEPGRRGRGEDPVLPEKKRARRRLVGAVALALAAAVGLPMLLDSEPKPLAGDIAIHIPSKEKAAPLPVPTEPGPAAPVQDAAASDAGTMSDPVPLADSVDSGEEIVDAPPAVTAAPPAAVAPPPKAQPSEPAPVRTVETAKPDPLKPEAKPDAPKTAPRKPEPEKKPVKLAESEAAANSAKPAREDDSARALAILEGKSAAKPEGPAPRYVVQVAALASQEKAAELQSRLRAAGVSSFTQKSGELIRVRVGPFSKEEAEKTRAKLGSIGLSGTMVPL